LTRGRDAVNALLVDLIDNADMPQATARSPIDLAHLARYTGGDAQLDSEVLDLFVSQCAGQLRRLEALLAVSDGKSWREIAHSLKGASSGIGAFALAEIAAKAELLDPGTEHARAAEALHALHRHADIVKTFIDAYLGR
jgi:HPt (histidine-containing phosphotransfer) domain-containing protein